MPNVDYYRKNVLSDLRRDLEVALQKYRDRTGNLVAVMECVDRLADMTGATDAELAIFAVLRLEQRIAELERAAKDELEASR